MSNSRPLRLDMSSSPYIIDLLLQFLLAELGGSPRFQIDLAASAGDPRLILFVLQDREPNALAIGMEDR